MSGRADFYLQLMVRAPVVEVNLAYWVNQQLRMAAVRMAIFEFTSGFGDDFLERQPSRVKRASTPFVTRAAACIGKVFAFLAG
jgi:hypothetical protein